MLYLNIERFVPGDLSIYDSTPLNTTSSSSTTFISLIDGGDWWLLSVLHGCLFSVVAVRGWQRLLADGGS